MNWFKKEPPKYPVKRIVRMKIICPGFDYSVTASTSAIENGRLHVYTIDDYCVASFNAGEWKCLLVVDEEPKNTIPNAPAIQQPAKIVGPGGEKP
jgi:hypothetical protein